MMAAMQHGQPHHIHRHPALPWAELRVSRDSPHCYRLHMHAEYSIGIVDAGQARFQHASGGDAIQTGAVVLIEPGHWHACNPQHVRQWSYRMLYLQAEWLHQLTGMQAIRFAHRALHLPAITQRVDQLCQPWPAHTNANLWVEQLEALLRQPGLLQPGRDSEDRATPALDPLVEYALQQMHDQLEHQPDTAFNVQTLAHAVDLTPPQFIRRFKAATGVTPGAYRLQLRINGARRLLAQGAPLADAAHRMGFADQSHLQRAFRDHHALTPGRYAQGSIAAM